MPDHHWQFAVASDRVEEFSAAIGEGRGPGVQVPPTYAMALVGANLFDLLRGLAIDPGNDTVLHTSQRFDYTRQLRPGEHVDCRLSLAESRDQLHGRTLKLMCDFTAADGTPVMTATTGLLITRNSAKGHQ